MRGDRLDGEGWGEERFWRELPGGSRRHRYRFWIAADEERRSYRLSGDHTEGEVIGMEVLHLRDDNQWCGGYITPDTDTVRRYGIEYSGHQIVSLDPLTITPSLACKQCPSHGFVTDGEWIGAPD